MEKIGAKQETKTYNIEKLMQDGQVEIDNRITFNDGIFQYITAASEVQDELVTSNTIIPNQRITTIQQSYFFALRNGLIELLSGSTAINDRYY